MKRDISIDLLKFLAVVFVVNSHMDKCYPPAYKFLATGGSLGDALFFFCSGFTLFLGRNDGFVCWYKRRLARILPSVIVCVLAYACWMGPGWYDAVGGYWFVRCILLYYVILFLIRRHFIHCLWVPFVLMGALVCAWWFGFEDPRHSIYGGGYFMWCHYFVPMLLGAVAGLNRERMKFRPVLDLVGLVGSVAAYYAAWKFAFCHVGYEWLQLVSIPFLSLAILFLYRVANGKCLLKFMGGVGGSVLTVVGGLCLEVYLSHRVFLVSHLNGIFPLNLPILFAAILVLAYLVRIASRFCTQTFDGADGYDWRKMIKLK